MALTETSLVRAATQAVAAFYRGAHGEPDLPTRLLLPLFARLSTERKLFLAREVTIGMTGACLEAKDRWGDSGNVIIAGNEIRVGVYSGERFMVRGRGMTWKAAFEDAGPCAECKQFYGCRCSEEHS
jgi:hypothetical protein